MSNKIAQGSPKPTLSERVKEAAENVADKALTASMAVDLKNQVKDVYVAAKGLVERPSSTGKALLPEKLGAVGGALASGVLVPGMVGTAVSDVRQAARTGTRADIAQALASTSDAAGTALLTAQGVAQAVVDVSTFVSARRAAMAAVRAAAPQVGREVADAAARSAARAAVRGASGAALQRVVARSVARTLPGTASRVASRAIVRSSTRLASRAALRATAQVGAGPVSRAAGRFIPGVNVALAAVDVATASATVANPSASAGKKAVAVLTALGSVGAATNIPIVSQVGAAVSAAGAVATAFVK